MVAFILVMDAHRPRISTKDTAACGVGGAVGACRGNEVGVNVQCVVWRKLSLV